MPMKINGQEQVATLARGVAHAGLAKGEMMEIGKRLTAYLRERNLIGPSRVAKDRGRPHKEKKPRR